MYEQILSRIEMNGLDDTHDYLAGWVADADGVEILDALWPAFLEIRRLRECLNRKGEWTEESGTSKDFSDVPLHVKRNGRCDICGDVDSPKFFHLQPWPWIEKRNDANV